MIFASDGPRSGHPIAPMPFIVGCPRSGTTLLRLMLDAHPELAIPSETHFLFAFAEHECREAISAEDLYRTVVSHFTWRDFGLESAAFRAALKEVEPFNVTTGLRTFYRLYAARFGKTRWGEKTPDYGAVMPQLEAIFPEARFIHIIRDGRDVALSKRHLWFGPGNDVQALADDWVQWIVRARNLASRCTHYMEVQYEDLVTDTEMVLRTVCEFIELPFDVRMLRYYEHADDRAAELKGWPELGLSAEKLRSLGELTKLPPQINRTGRWRSEMTPGERGSFEDVAGALLLKLGYELDPPLPAVAHAGPGLEPEPTRMNMLLEGEMRQVQVEALSVPNTLDANASFAADVSVSNLGARALCSAGPFPVNLAYHWFDYRTGDIVLWDGARTPLHPPLACHQTGTYRMHLVAPELPGDYTLQLALVQEGVSWFEEQDSSHGCKARVRIQAAVTAE